MKIALCSDHGGFLLKEEIKTYLESKGHQVEDVGTHSLESCDYPLFARAAAEKVASEECEVGIVVCTSGEGVCITANKVKGIRCGLVYNNDVAHLIREHNNANMMALGANYTTKYEAFQYIDTYLGATFQGGRHLRRVNEIEE